MASAAPRRRPAGTGPRSGLQAPRLAEVTSGWSCLFDDHPANACELSWTLGGAAHSADCASGHRPLCAESADGPTSGGPATARQTDRAHGPGVHKQPRGHRVVMTSVCFQVHIEKAASTRGFCKPEVTGWSESHCLSSVDNLVFNEIQNPAQAQ